MSKTIFAGAVALVLGGTCADSANAQVLSPRTAAPMSGPTVSPYLNLARNPNAPTLNYFGLVRPQFETNAGLRALQQQQFQGQTGPLPGAEPADNVLVTGHAAVFMNYGGYFQSSIGAMQASRFVPTSTVRQATSTSTPTRLPRPGPR